MAINIKDLPQASLPLQASDITIIDQTDAFGARKTRKVNISDLPSQLGNEDWGLVTSAVDLAPYDYGSLF